MHQCRWPYIRVSQHQPQLKLKHPTGPAGGLALGYVGTVTPKGFCQCQRPVMVPLALSGCRQPATRTASGTLNPGPATASGNFKSQGPADNTQVWGERRRDARQSTQIAENRVQSNPTLACAHRCATCVTRFRFGVRGADSLMYREYASLGASCSPSIFIRRAHGSTP
jgi:hypothetical protein